MAMTHSPCPGAYAKDWRLSPCNGAGSDHSAARKAARDARKLRAEALAAHMAAAVAIERANNQDRGLDDWTLDLHGLHVAEATAALSRRSVIFKEELLRVIRQRGFMCANQFLAFQVPQGPLARPRL